VSTEPTKFAFGEFTFGESADVHTVGDRECEGCWRQPEPHNCEASGCLEHNVFGDENADCDYWLYTLGDLCREAP
jgi:hypothetical protein